MSASPVRDDVDYLRDILECPVCLGTPKNTPIYQCNQGHVICNECHGKLKDCPVCLVPLGKIRSLVSEKVLSRWLTRPCIFYKYGCKQEFPECGIDEHEEECSYRLIECLECYDSIPFKSYMVHFKTHLNPEEYEHKAESPPGEGLLVEELNFIVPDSQGYYWSIGVLSHEEKKFFFLFAKYETDLWFGCVYFLGSPKEASEYRCTIRIYKEDEELLFTGRVISLDAPSERPPYKGRGLTFNDATAKYFWDADNEKITYSVSVFKQH